MSAKPTQKKNSELEQRVVDLQQHQAQSNALFASIGEGAIATDDEGRINKVNQPALDMLGFEEHEVLGEWFPKIIVAEDENGNTIPTIRRQITQAFLSGTAVTGKIYYRRKDGSRLPVAITVSPIVLNNRPIGAVEVFRDISHEHEVDRMKTEFIYLASHQLRTPLTAVKTYTHMLHDGFAGELTSDQKEFMQAAFVSLDRMNEIINTLLNISRIEAGRIALTPSKFTLEDIVLESLAELQPAIDTKQITVNTEHGTTDRIQSDAMLVKEVLSNLISNAVKYTPPQGEITVRITKQGTQQTVSIQDSGYGIPDAVQEQLFTKFFRAPNILDKEEGGSGLGLYLVKGLTDALNADINFTSKENKGSTFVFTINEIINTEEKM